MHNFWIGIGMGEDRAQRATLRCVKPASRYIHILSLGNQLAAALVARLLLRGDEEPRANPLAAIIGMDADIV